MPINKTKGGEFSYLCILDLCRWWFTVLPGRCKQATFQPSIRVVTAPGWGCNLHRALHIFFFVHGIKWCAIGVSLLFAVGREGA